jgi:hypothetical protein
VYRKLGWAPEPVWTLKPGEKSSALVTDRTPVVQSAVRHYTNWATRLTPQSSTKVENIRSYAFFPLYSFRARFFIRHKDNFMFMCYFTRFINISKYTGLPAFDTEVQPCIGKTIKQILVREKLGAIIHWRDT